MVGSDSEGQVTVTGLIIGGKAAIAEYPRSTRGNNKIRTKCKSFNHQQSRIKAHQRRAGTRNETRLAVEDEYYRRRIFRARSRWRES